MALIFNRPSFRSGIITVKEPDGDDWVTYTFRPSDKGQAFDFIDEAYILENYSIMFTQASEAKKKGVADAPEVHERKEYSAVDRDLGKSQSDDGKKRKGF